MTLTHARLTYVINYDRATGIFTWRVARNNVVKIGDIAGSKNHDGYIRISIDRRLYMAHRLAWLYVTGDWVKAEIDHINGIRDDNRFANLRMATRSENCRNRRVPKTNKSGLKGVCFDKRQQKWHAQIGTHGKVGHIGYFRTAEEAAAAYDKRAIELYGPFALTNQSLR